VVGFLPAGCGYRRILDDLQPGANDHVALLIESEVALSEKSLKETKLDYK